MSELLFECYGVPQVAYCVDSLTSYAFNSSTPTGPLPDGLIINVGHHNTLVIPVLDGFADYGRSRRIKIGGHSMTRFLYRWLQLQYSHHANAITLSRAEVKIVELFINEK